MLTKTDTHGKARPEFPIHPVAKKLLPESGDSGKRGIFSAQPSVPLLKDTGKEQLKDRDV